MKLSAAIDLYVQDMRAEGRLTSAASERGYRAALDRLADTTSNRDPRLIGRDDLKRCLATWPHPNTQRKNRSILVSFFDWTLEEGLRETNPARQTRRPKARPTSVYRLTRHEVRAFLQASVAAGPVEARACHLGVLAGLRNAELRGLLAEHVTRPGFLHVPATIAKGGRERWIPVLPELEPVIAEIRAHVPQGRHVLPAMRWRDPGRNTTRQPLDTRGMSTQALRSLVMRVARDAGIRAHVHPHLMRHAFGDHVARHAGIRNAQAMLGHATVGTTETYTGAPTLDDLARSVTGLRFGVEHEHSFLSPSSDARTPRKATTGIEPVLSPARPAPLLTGNLSEWFEPVAASVHVYMEAFARA